MYFYFLDALRGLAAIAVLLQHVVQAVNRGPPPTHSYLAVTLFFSLSGYVIAHAYGEKLEAGMTFAAYLWRRVVRLFPMIVLSLFLGAAVHLLNQGARGILPAPDVARALGMSLFLIPNFGLSREALFPLNGPLWSLFFEMVASVAFGLILFRLGNRMLAAVCVVSGVGFAGAIYALHGATFGWSKAHMDATLLETVFCFAAGVLAYRLTRARAALAGRTGMWVGLGTLAVVIGIFAFPAHPMARIVDLICAVVLLPAAVLAGSQVELRALKPLGVWLGAMSYPLYVLQNPILKALEYGLADHRAWIGPAALVITPLAAWVVLKVYDEPVRKWLSGLGRPPAVGGTALRSQRAPR